MNPTNVSQAAPKDPALQHARARLTHQLAAGLDMPMTVLAFVWLVLMIVDLTQGLSGWLAVLNDVIWGLFILHFVLEFTIAPHKGRYLKRNWLTAIALVLPALRIFRTFRAFRIFRATRAVRSTGLVRVVATFNRGLKAVRKGVRRRGLGYVALVTLLATFAGAAGMFAFENHSALREDGKPADERLGFGSYADALWWTAMIMTTMGSDYFPRTPEGRLLCWLLAVYAFAVFGYLTASIASFFVDADRKKASLSPVDGDLTALRTDIERLRTELASAVRQLGGRDAAP